MDRWLGSRLHGIRSGAELRAINVSDALLDLLDWNQHRQLDALAPTHFVAPTGSRLPIDYSDPRAPVVRVRLQEMFGCVETPCLLGGRVPLTLHLLSPALRPVQVTQNLATFWASSYGDVRRELRGRYPRHAWPDDPLSAQPTRRTKPRGP
jgi:ATP-dependent helicase HrpB